MHDKLNSLSLAFSSLVDLSFRLGKIETKVNRVYANSHGSFLSDRFRKERDAIANLVLEQTIEYNRIVSELNEELSKTWWDKFKEKYFKNQHENK